MFLDVKQPHPKPPRNPAWIAAAILAVLSISVLGWFKFRGGDTEPLETVEVSKGIDSEPAPPEPPLEPVDIRTGEDAATFSLSPVTETSENQTTPGSVVPAAAPPKLELPTLRAAPTTVAPTPTTPPADHAATETVMSAPRVPGMLTSRMSGQGAAGAPSVDTSMPTPADSRASSATTTDRSAPDTTTTSSPPSPTIVSPPAPAPPTGRGVSRKVANLFEAQLALDRAGFSAGSIDGVYGGQTRLALLAFQQREQLAMSGRLDAETMSRLNLEGDAYATYRVTETDLKGLAPLPESWTGKAQQPRLVFASLLELIAEKHHASPKYIGRLNPQVNWTAVAAGTSIKVPAAARPAPREKAAFIRIRLSDRTVQAFDQKARIIAHYPCSIAAAFANRPQGALSVKVLVEDPNYTFDPKRFPNTIEGRTLVAKLIIPAGPNNPVGSAWIGLDKPGYGIHGTPDPESIGKTGSMGCFRLANWNARHLVKLAWIGMPVYVVR